MHHHWKQQGCKVWQSRALVQWFEIENGRIWGNVKKPWKWVSSKSFKSLKKFLRQENQLIEKKFQEKNSWSAISSLSQKKCFCFHFLNCAPLSSSLSFLSLLSLSVLTTPTIFRIRFLEKMPNFWPQTFFYSEQLKTMSKKGKIWRRHEASGF